MPPLNKNIAANRQEMAQHTPVFLKHPSNRFFQKAVSPMGKLDLWRRPLAHDLANRGGFSRAPTLSLRQLAYPFVAQKTLAVPN